LTYFVPPKTLVASECTIRKNYDAKVPSLLLSSSYAERMILSHPHRSYCFP